MGSGFGADAFDGIKVMVGTSSGGAALVEEVTRRRSLVMPSGGGVVSGAVESASGRLEKEKQEQREEDARQRGVVADRMRVERERRERCEATGVDWRGVGFGRDGSFFRVYISADELYAGVKEYFDKMERRGLVPGGEDGDVNIPEPMTIEGLCDHLRVPVRDFIENYGYGAGYEEFWGVVEWAKNRISEFLIRHGLMKTYNSTLLWSLLKQHSEYFDKRIKEIPVLPGGSGGGVFGGRGLLHAPSSSKSGGGEGQATVSKEYHINLIPGNAATINTTAETSEKLEESS